MKKKIPISTEPLDERNIVAKKKKPENNVDKRLSIQHYRRKKQKKKLYTIVLMGLLCFLILVSIFFVVETIGQGRTAKKASAEHFPINLTGENLRDINVVDNNLVLTGDVRTLMYHSDAQRSSEIIHKLSSPVAKVNGNTILSYSEGGTTVRLDDKNTEIKSIETENEILFCEISKTGYVAVATTEERYNSSITIYDNKLREIYKYNDSKNYIDGFSFVSNKKGVVLMHGTENAKFNSMIYGLDFTKDKETEYFKKTFDDVVAYSMNVQETGNIAVTTDVGFIVLSKDGEEVNRYDYTNQVRFIAERKNSTVVALANNIDINKTDLIIFSDSGELQFRETVPTNVTDIFCDDDGIVVTDRHNIFEYSYSLKLLKTYKNSNNCTQTVRLDGSLFGIASDSLFMIE